jgi:signal transduction histidine kinase
MRGVFFIWMMTGMAYFTSGQSPVIQISRWPAFDVVDSYVFVSVDSASKTKLSDGHQLHYFRPSTEFLNTPISSASSRFQYYYRFDVLNDSPDTVNYFVLGSPQRHFEAGIYQQHPRTVVPMPMKQVPYWLNSEAKVAMLAIPPHQPQTVYVKLMFPYYREVPMYIFLIEQNSLNTFLLSQNGLRSKENSFSWFYCGMLFMMFMYITLKFIQIRTREYFYYGAYIFFFLVYFGLKLLSGVTNEWIFYSDWYSGFANDQLQSAAYIMYFLFFQQFMRTKITMPDLHRFIGIIIYLLLVYIVLDGILFFVPETIFLKNTLWTVIRGILLVITLYCIWRTAKAQIPVGGYLITGGLLLSFFALAAMIFTFQIDWIKAMPPPFHWPITYFQIGVACELICFTLGLGYKNRKDELKKLEAETQLRRQEDRLEFERYKTMTEAREAERGRIAKDLHDGLGGMLTGVRLSLANLKPSTPEDQSQLHRSLDMLDGSVYELRRIAQDLMPLALQRFGLTSALRDYTSAVHSMGIVNVNFQVMGEVRRLSGEHELICYRLIQELVNNALKHAHAKSILVQVVFQKHALELTVEDDGRGFDKKVISDTGGSGWSNIQSRVSYLKGTIDLQTNPDEGVSVHVHLPV